MACILCTAGMAEELILEGKVRDANTHREIPNVNIYIAELNIGTTTSPIGRFRLRVVNPDPQMIVTFQHVAYDTLNLTIEEVLSRKYIDMQERVVLAPVVQVEPLEDQLEVEKDISSTVSVIGAQVFDLSGYIDAGELLRTDYSIQVDEELSGKKTVSIRGGTPDEVVVLYNGVKLNNALDNVFDISLIDLTDVQRFEIIKGSNTTLYGSEAFSGVINVVPRAQQDYNIRLQHRFGTFDSRSWGVSLYKNLGRFHGSYSIKKGGWKRQFADEPEGRRRLENDSEHHTASLVYNFSETPTGKPLSSLGIMYLRSAMDYHNERDTENLSNLNQMISMRFTGDMGSFLRNVSISGAYQWLDEQQFLRFFAVSADSGFFGRDVSERSWHFNADKSWRFRYVEFLAGYQFKDSHLSFADNRSSFVTKSSFLERSTLQRRSQGVVGILKLRLPSRSRFVQGVNFDLSVRYDRVIDKPVEVAPEVQGTATEKRPRKTFSGNSWKEGMIKFSTHVSGTDGKNAFTAFFNVGTNVKFPTLLQEISNREVLLTESTRPNLQPERNRNIEVGFEFIRETRHMPVVYGWEISANFFRNTYDNKFRPYFLPGTPIAVYDNVADASISGFEGKASLYLFRKKMTMELGASRYFFSDPATFPFKYDRKLTLNVFLDHGGYSLRLHAFREGEQIAKIRSNDPGGFSEQRIPAYTNLNVYFGKTFEFHRFNLILNLSARNLLDDDFALEGLTLRDRRYYVTLAVQY